MSGYDPSLVRNLLAAGERGHVGYSRPRGSTRDPHARGQAVHAARWTEAGARMRRLELLREAMKRWLVDWELLVSFVAMAALLVALGVLGLLASA